MTTYSATLVRNEITVKANSPTEAKAMAIKKFTELLKKDENEPPTKSKIINIDEELDSWD